MYTTSATKLLYVHRTHFHAFMRLVKDFEARVKRIAALRRKAQEGGGVKILPAFSRAVICAPCVAFTTGPRMARLGAGDPS